MPDLAYQLLFDGEAAEDELYADVLELVIDERAADATTVQLKLATTLDEDGEWTYLSDDRLALFAPVAVSLGYEEGSGIAGAIGGLLGAGGNEGVTPLFAGHVAGVDVSLGSSPGQTTLTVSLVDASLLMGLEEKVAVWRDLSDGEVIERIVADYADSTDVDTTETVHQENDYVLVQRGTDLQFVRMLARRNGLEFAFAVDPDSGDVVATCKTPQLDDAPQPALAIQFGDESNLTSFAVRVDGRRPLSVKVVQTDIRGKSPIEAQVADASLTPLGADDLASLARGSIESLASPAQAASQLLLLGAPSSNATELETFALAARDEAGWFMTATGEINCDAYGAVLRPRGTVLVKGAGDRFSGAYYVVRVTHTLTSDGRYAQRFEARRNARGLDGSELFDGDDLALALPGL